MVELAAITECSSNQPHLTQAAKKKQKCFSKTSCKTDSFLSAINSDILLLREHSDAHFTWSRSSVILGAISGSVQ